MTAITPTAPPPEADNAGGTDLDHLDAARAELLEDAYVLRMTETQAEQHSGLTDDQHMIMNLGPQHPSPTGCCEWCSSWRVRSFVAPVR